MTVLWGANPMTVLWGASHMTVLWGASPMTVLWDTTPYDGYMGSPLYYGLRTLNRNTRRVNRRGALRAAVQGVLAGFLWWRQQAMRDSALRPPGLCLPLAHLRHRETRANAGHRALAGHAPMRTGGGAAQGRGGHFEAIFRGWLPGIGVHK